MIGEDDGRCGYAPPYIGLRGSRVLPLNHIILYVGGQTDSVAPKTRRDNNDLSNSDSDYLSKFFTRLFGRCGMGKFAVGTIYIIMPGYPKDSIGTQQENNTYLRYLSGNPYTETNMITMKVDHISQEAMEETKMTSHNPHLSQLSNLQLAQCALRDLRDMLNGAEWKRISVEHFLEILVERLKEKPDHKCRHMPNGHCETCGEDFRGD